MSDQLFESAPGFDQPVDMLTHCHSRIRKQLQTMQNLVAHLSKFGSNLDARQGSTAVLKYFNTAAHHHHADEEEDLLPMLQTTAKGEDAELLTGLMPQILEEHLQMDAAWQILAEQLQRIATGESAELSEQDVNRFVEIYATHMEKEETHIAPMAKRLFNTEQIKQLGNAMRNRRGIA